MARPLSARSIVASTLLGTHPPVLSSRLLVAFAGEFGVSAGTTRVAISRMVDRGELETDDGRYRLAGPLLDRQARQEAGLRPDVRAWSGAWEMRLVRSGSRSGSDRADLRRALEHLGLRESREGVWLRPDNLDPARLPGARAVADTQTDRWLARPEAEDGHLAADLFALATWAGEARLLAERMDGLIDRLEAGDRDVLAPGFELAAGVLRHLVADPRLPPALLPADWPGDELRRRYRDYEGAYRAVLADFFADHHGHHRVASEQRHGSRP